MTIRALEIGACVLAGLLAVGCDIALDISQPSASPTAPSGPSITNTNTNTSTNNNDRSDTQPAGPADGGTGGTGGAALPLPAYGESETRAIAAANPALVTNSCQLTSGDAAWAFLDVVISTLQARDARWGYLCKDAGCTSFGRDVITYKASAGDTGIFIVDIIGNHCPGPTDSPAAVRWGVLPFETVRRWSATRR